MSDFVTTHYVKIGDTGKDIVVQLRDANGPLPTSVFTSVEMHYKYATGLQVRAMTAQAPAADGKWKYSWVADDFTKLIATTDYKVEFKATKADGSTLYFPSSGNNLISATLPLS
jgi:hypothetical protein